MLDELAKRGELLSSTYVIFVVLQNPKTAKLKLKSK
jgi:hypothetical protein